MRHKKILAKERILYELAAHGSPELRGAGIFWMRRLSLIDSEQEAIEHWQIKRDGSKRGIVEVIINDQE